MILVSGCVIKYVELLISQEFTFFFLALYLIYRHRIILFYPAGWTAASSSAVPAWPGSVQMGRQLGAAIQPMRCSPRALAKGLYLIKGRAVISLPGPTVLSTGPSKGP